jgi:hypothetical protein
VQSRIGYALGAPLAAVALMLGCQAEPAPPQAAVVERKQAMAAAPVVERLHRWPPPRPAVPTSQKRNPFVLGAPEGDEGAAPPAALSADSLPELPLPLPDSNVRLLGIAGGQTPEAGRTAILTVGNDLVLVREGETVGGRYRVVRVGEESADLLDAVGNKPLHLAWR